MFTLTAETTAHSSQSRRLSPARLAAGMIARMITWQEVARQRRRLTVLDERLLADIGISRVEAAREAGKACWR